MALTNSVEEPTTTSNPVISPSLDVKRVASVDAYRGLVMFLMMAEILSFRSVSEALPESSFLRFLYFNQDHVAWVGLSLHDLIQPSFSFLVGVALPFSIAGRMAKGGSFSGMLKSALIRSLILIVLGIFLRSLWSDQTNFTFEDTLTQIGLGYPFLFLLGFCTQRVQILSLAGILMVYWLAFALYPLPGPSFDYSVAGIPPNWEHHLQGFAAHWNKNTNLAWAFDRWFLNLFPRESPFSFNSGGYSTLSFIPTLGTMILGLIGGSILKSGKTGYRKVRVFLLIGLGLTAIGAIIHFTGVNPIVKRIWTPAWAIFSGGLCFLFLSVFYWIIDVANHKKWFQFLIIIGMNSIVAYVLADGFGSFFIKSLYIHLGENYDQVFGLAYASLVRGTLVLCIEFLILRWMYKRKIFIKI